MTRKEPAPGRRIAPARSARRVALAATLALSTAAGASDLYSGSLHLRRINQEDATNLGFVMTLSSAGPRGYSGLPGSDRILFAVAGDLDAAILERIDVEARTVDTLVVAPPPGFDSVTLTDLAVDPTDPDVAIVVGDGLFPGLERLVFPLDLTTARSWRRSPRSTSP